MVPMRSVVNQLPRPVEAIAWRVAAAVDLDLHHRGDRAKAVRPGKGRVGEGNDQVGLRTAQGRVGDRVRTSGQGVQDGCAHQGAEATVDGQRLRRGGALHRGRLVAEGPRTHHPDAAEVALQPAVGGPEVLRAHAVGVGPVDDVPVGGHVDVGADGRARVGVAGPQDGELPVDRPAFVGVQLAEQHVVHVTDVRRRPLQGGGSRGGRGLLDRRAHLVVHVLQVLEVGGSPDAHHGRAGVTMDGGHDDVPLGHAQPLPALVDRL